MLRHFTFTLVSLLMVAGIAGPVAAFERSEGIFAQVYLSVPFGGGEAERSVPSFGFSVGPTVAFGGDSLSPDDSYETTPFADIRFTSEGLSALSFGGLDAVEKDIRLSANGEEEDSTNINWTYVGLGIAGAALLGVLAFTDGGDAGNILTTKKICKKHGGRLEKGKCVAK